jgi:hypothetical protein
VVSKRVVFIVGSGYSGSTLLDLILGCHARSAGFGELREFDAFVEADGPCTCGATATSCPFWTEVRSILGASFRLYPAGADMLTILGRTLRLLEAVGGVSGAEAIVDSSKWVDRARLLGATGELDARVVHLVRDGRGVLWSRLRRQLPAEASLRRWCAQNEAALSWLGRADAPPNLRVRYEDLAHRPAETVARVCALADLDFRPEMLRFREGKAHMVSGNAMRLGGTSDIVVDETWRTALEPEHLRLFEQVTGDLPQRLGYRDLESA